jgi:tRNA uridine 5-carboxymethylaminomethyl modification enzyme
MQLSYDVIVVGAGHAGCEAALAAARSGTRTALLTVSSKLIACMPCNPSIGGIAKSHLVHEIDALGGEMAVNTDNTGIHFRTLNTRRGPAVQATRVQCDKVLYSCRMQAVLAECRNVDIIEDEVVELSFSSGRLVGVKTIKGADLRAKCVILTPGTAMGGVIHIGDRSYPGGGNGGPAAHAISKFLRSIGIVMERLKTGTPPRIKSESIDFSLTEQQPGEVPVPLMSQRERDESELFHVEHSDPGRFSQRLFHVEQKDTRLRPWRPGSNQVMCYLTHTNKETHRIISDNLHKSSLYGGYITGTGARYCPSLEDKVVKFADKDRHHIFLEPEGRGTSLIYPNGISNSLPEDVQLSMIRSIEGLKNAEVSQWAFAIEYDFCDPTQLYPSLESKSVENLYFAGQINGTTGYEEAAAQGFVAGVNAARKIRGEPAFHVPRSDAYIGVLIDDLTTRGTHEPYRMFTSLSENRLMLRQDNVRFRLRNHANTVGLVPKSVIVQTDRLQNEIDREFVRLASVYHSGDSLLQILRRPGVLYCDLPSCDPVLSLEVVQQIEVQAKYQGYIDQERTHIERARQYESVALPADLDYFAIPSLRYEAREKMKRIRPVSLGHAARIPGISPADISVLTVYIKRHASS